MKKRAFFLRYRNIVFTVFGLLLLTYAVMRIVRPNSALIASFEIGRNVKQVAISPNANYVAALDYEGRVFWWNTSTKALIHQIEVKGIDFFDLVFSKDEKLIVTGDNLGFVRVFDVETGDLRFSEQVLTPDVAHIVLRVMDDGSTYPKQGGVFDLAMSNDGSLLMAGGVNGQVALISTNQWIITYKAQLSNDFDITSLFFSRNNTYIGIASHDSSGIAVVWDVSGRRQVTLIDLGRLYDRLETIGFDASGNQLIVGGYPRYLALFDYRNERVDNFKQFTFDARNFSAMRISPDGVVVARAGFAANGDQFFDGLPFIGQGDYTIYLYRRQETQQFMFRDKPGLCYQEDPHNSTITLPIACPTLREFQKLYGHREGVTSIDIDLQNTYLVSGSRDGAVNLWQITKT